MNGWSNVAAQYHPNPDDNVMGSIFQQYERVVIESLITSFGLDFIVRDQHGGDVDTVHNVRQIGKDENMSYKNKQNEAAYNNRPEYNSAEYHSDSRYIQKNREIRDQKKAGVLKDTYTGEDIRGNDTINLDHVVSAKEIHDDRGRVLAGLDGRDLANSDSNLQPTVESINKSKKARSVSEYIEYLQKRKTENENRLNELNKKKNLTDQERKEQRKLQQLLAVDEEKLKKADEKARREMDAKINAAYYTSPRFAKDTAIAAGKVGIKMGIRQALGFIFAEIWFAVKDEFQKVKGEFKLKEFLTVIGNGIQRGVNNAKQKYKQIMEKIKEGFVAGALSSLTTTLCNIFFTTAKNVVKIIRQSYASLVSAATILFLNPDNLPFGERMRAVVKVIAAGASVIVGGLVSEAIGKTPIGVIPVIGDIVQTFCGTFVAGVMSCTLLYFMDRNPLIQRLVSVLNTLPSISNDINFYKMQAEKFKIYAAELMKIDIEQFRRETAVYESLADELESADNDAELNIILKNATIKLGIQLPWQGDFDQFMSNKENVLVFE